MKKCEQELCPFWSGSGCICEATGIGPTDRHLGRAASEGWAAYAAEQERHAETVARLDEVEGALQRARAEAGADCICGPLSTLAWPDSGPRCLPCRIRAALSSAAA